MKQVILRFFNGCGSTRSFMWNGHCAVLESAKRRFAADYGMSELVVIVVIF